MAQGGFLFCDFGIDGLNPLGYSPGMNTTPTTVQPTMNTTHYPGPAVAFDPNHVFTDAPLTFAPLPTGCPFCCDVNPDTDLVSAGSVDGIPGQWWFGPSENNNGNLLLQWQAVQPDDERGAGGGLGDGYLLGAPDRDGFRTNPATIAGVSHLLRQAMTYDELRDLGFVSGC